MKAGLKRQIEEMNRCVDDIARYIKQSRNIELSEAEKNNIGAFVATAMIFVMKKNSCVER